MLSTPHRCQETHARQLDKLAQVTCLMSDNIVIESGKMILFWIDVLISIQ